MEAGLSNVCYQNSLLQTLAATEDFRSRLLSSSLVPLHDDGAASSSSSSEDAVVPLTCASPRDVVERGTGNRLDATRSLPFVALRRRRFMCGFPLLLLPLQMCVASRAVWSDVLGGGRCASHRHSRVTVFAHA